MPYEKFDSRGKQKPEISLLEDRTESPFIVAVKVAVILLGIRLVMLATGVSFFRIPVVDSFLIPIVKLFR